MSPIRIRKAIPVLPFLRLNLSASGISWTWHLGPWSWNSRRETHRINFPGPVDYETRRDQ